MANDSTVQEITARLESGIKELFESDKYALYLKTMSRFHNYSPRNILLIYSQKPDATRIAGYSAWKSKFNRQVRKGERSIKILAPIPYNVTEVKEKLDPATNKPVIGEDGQPVMEELVMRKSARFKPVSVFDISQTEGEPLPQLAEDITGDVARYGLFMETLSAVSPLPIAFENLPPGTDGVCRFGKGIAVRAGMSEAQTVSAAIHEIAHALLHDTDAVRDGGAPPKDRRTEEIEAESISYAVNQHYGIETGANSFGYIAEWGRGREMKELKASLGIIQKTAAGLIDGIDENYRALAKERGIDLAAVRESGREKKEPGTPATGKAAASSPVDRIFEENRDLVAGLAAAYMSSSGGMWHDDEAAARHACDQCVDRVMTDLLLKAGDNYALWREYMDNQDFKEKIRDYALAKAWAEPKEAERRRQRKIADMRRPDPAVGIGEMNAYGYESDAMLPLTRDRAYELLDAGLLVYQLHPDNSEAMVFTPAEIKSHGGLFGIEKGDWEKAYPKHSGLGGREAGLLHGGGSKFGIYQIPSGAENGRDLRFASMGELETRGIGVDRANYELVHVGDLGIYDTLTNLNRIYAVFQGGNPARPADYTARSVSVSDVIVLSRQGEVSAHYVDSAGFRELDLFTGSERQPDVLRKKEVENYNLKRRPATKGKPSLLAALNDARQEAARNRTASVAANRKQERGSEL